eukprot:jgi/Botrbrau1/5184/Bobra.0172s0054.1
MQRKGLRNTLPMSGRHFLIASLIAFMSSYAFCMESQGLAVGKLLYAPSPPLAAKDVANKAWWTVEDDISCFRGKIHIDSGTCKCSMPGDSLLDGSACCPANSTFSTTWQNCQCLYGFTMSKDNQCIEFNEVVLSPLEPVEVDLSLGMNADAAPSIPLAVQPVPPQLLYNSTIQSDIFEVLATGDVMGAAEDPSGGSQYAAVPAGMPIAQGAGPAITKIWTKAIVNPFAPGLKCASDQTTVVDGYIPVYCLDDIGFSTNNGDPINYYYCNGKINQQWEIVKDTATNLFKVSSTFNNLCWDDWDGQDRQTLRQYDCTTGTQANQQFKFTFKAFVPGCSAAAAKAYYQISVVAKDGATRCLTQPTDGSPTQFRSCSNNPNDVSQSFLVQGGGATALPPSPPPIGKPSPPPPPAPAGSQVSVLTDRYDNARSGVNGQETVLTPALLKAGRFGKLGQFVTDGQVYTHPLVVPNLNINGKTVTGVVVATQKNYVYMFDAATRAAIWATKQLGNPLTPADVGGCNDVQPFYGITGTPVVDAAAGVVYVAANSKPTTGAINGGQSSKWTLYSLDLKTGQNKYNPLIIQGSSTLNGVTKTFQPTWQLQRAGLVLSQGKVLVSFGSHCDGFEYEGWVFATKPSTGQIPAIWRSVNPQGSDGGGVWQSGVAPAVDAFGNVYVTTGNGPNQNGQYGNGVVKLAPPPDSGTWTVQDYFIPSDNPQEGDLDLGSGGATLFKIGSKTVISVAGKAAKTWIIDTSNMGKFSTNTYQSIPNTGFQMGGQLFDPNLKRLWINPQTFGNQKNLQVFQLGSNGYFQGAAIGTGPQQQGLGGTPTLSHNNGRDGIVWTLGSGGLKAYDATSTGNISPIYTDTPGGYVKFQQVMVANGLVFVAADGAVNVYGVK